MLTTPMKSRMLMLRDSSCFAFIVLIIIVRHHRRNAATIAVVIERLARAVEAILNAVERGLVALTARAITLPRTVDELVQETVPFARARTANSIRPLWSF